jgi:BMFP domain-containing protein YqiC
MDKDFLEFWGNFLLTAAKSQEKLEEMSKWIHQGFRGFENLQAMFRKYYRLDEDSPNYSNEWNKAEADFRQSFQDYLSLLGLVPREEHLALVKKYEQLKEKLVAQEETIRHLKMLLEEKGIDQAKVMSDFEKLIAEQGEQFRELMKSYSELYKTDKDRT